MGIGISVILLALGAILIWAIDASVRGIELTTIGVILIIVGGIGALLSFVFWSSWGGMAGRPSRDERLIT
jgi:hypothetical protein